MTIFDRLKQKAQQAFTGISSGIQNWQANNRAAAQRTTVNPTAARLAQQGADLATGFAKNRIVEPLRQLPRNAQIATNPAAPFGQRALAGVQALGALSPGPEDVLFGAYDAVKAKTAGRDPGKAFTGEEYTGLGDAASRGQDTPWAAAGNVAELPLLLLAGGLKPKNVDEALDSATNISKNIGKQSSAIPTKQADDLFKRWVNTREGLANWNAGDVKRNPKLTAFDTEGMAAIDELQSGSNPKKFEPIKQFTDELFDKELKAGIVTPEKYRDNYLPQLWEDPPEVVQQVFNRTISGKPGFTKDRLFNDYKEGVEAGLTPKFDKISDLLESRSKTSTRAFADKEFLDNLVESGQAVPMNEAPKGWRVVPELAQGGTPFAVNPETAKRIENYTNQGSEILQKAGEFVSEAKGSLLSAGIPRSGWNFHTGVNIPVRAMTARNNPFGAAVDSVIWNTQPETAVKYVDSLDPALKEGLLKAGLSASRGTGGSDYAFKVDPGKGKVGEFRAAMDKLFSEAAFDKVLPAHKFKLGKEAYERAIKEGASQEQAYRIGAEAANTMFGGINVQEMGRSKDFQNIMRTLLLAPDWLETNVRLAVKSGSLLNPKNWSKPEYGPYKQYARNAAFAYASFAMLNKAISGHYPWENGPGQEFNMATGTYDERGRERMVSVFGTAFDSFRLPYLAVKAIAENDPGQIGSIVKNRLSPPLSAGVSLLSNKDYRGRDITSPEQTPLENIAGIAGQAGSAVGVPSQVSNSIQFARGESTPEELLTNLLEAPVRYRGGANTEKKREKAERLRDAGLSNEDIAKSFNTAPKVKKEEKGWLDGFFKGGVDKAGAAEEIPTDPALQAEYRKDMLELLEEDSTYVPSKEALTTTIFKNKSASAKSLEERTEAFKALDKALENELYSDEQKQAILGASGATPENAAFYKLASKDPQVKIQELMPKIQSMDTPQVTELLMQGRRMVGGKQLITAEMVDYFYEQGYIGEEEKDAIKALRWDEIKDEPYFTKAFLKKNGKGGGSGGGKKLSYAQAKKLYNIELPELDALKSVDALLTQPRVGSQTGGIDDSILEELWADSPNKSGGGSLWF